MTREIKDFLLRRGEKRVRLISVCCFYPFFLITIELVDFDWFACLFVYECIFSLFIYLFIINLKFLLVLY